MRTIRWIVGVGLIERLENMTELFELTEQEKQNILALREMQAKIDTYALKTRRLAEAAATRRPGQIEAIKRVEAMLEKAGIEIDAREYSWHFRDIESGHDLSQ